MKDLQNLPKLTDKRAYNYILLFNSGNIKIGISTDIEQRMKQLSNSNSGGYKIVNYYISPPNYIAATLEKYLHHIYKDNRIEGEFFSGLSFDDVCNTCNTIMNTSEFINANEIRRKYVTKSYCA